MNLPESFLQEMKDCLHDEYDEFFRAFSEDVSRPALRINPMKTSLTDLTETAGFKLEPVPWIENGYFYDENDQPSRHPAYAAGLYYIQEASAMTPASRLRVLPGDRVLDLCAAPGGKATALAAALRGEGLLMANDINKARARALLRNLELFGSANIFVTSKAPHKLAGRLADYFDKIMVDAPCSGEGMFRKNPAVATAWCQKGPDYFSKLQKDIILHAADMLKPGGKMLYSTCTFSPLENEAVISHLLKNRPEMSLIPMEDYEGFGPGLDSFRGETFDPSCHLCRRIWPHRMPGEGHFLALLKKEDRTSPAPYSDTGREKKSLKKKGKSKKGPTNWWQAKKKLLPEDRKSLESFFSKMDFDPDPDRIDIRADKVYYIPADPPLQDGINFLRNGLYLGCLKKKRFEPSQPLALYLREDRYPFSYDLEGREDLAIRYLKGEDLRLDDPPTQTGNWFLVTFHRHPLGFAKLTGNVLKNKYPPGWRI